MITSKLDVDAYFSLTRQSPFLSRYYSILKLIVLEICVY